MTASSNNVPFPSLATLLPKPATFADLPTELLMDIIELSMPWTVNPTDYLDLSLPRNAGPILRLRRRLSTLSLVNKRMHAVVSDNMLKSYSDSLSSPYTFLHYLTMNPTAGPTVRRLLFEGPLYFQGKFVFTPRIYGPSAGDERLIEEGIDALKLQRWSSLSRDCKDPLVNSDVILAAILLHTPKITYLAVGNMIDHGPNPRWLDVIRQHVTVPGESLGRVQRFAQLEHVKVYLPRSMVLSDLTCLFRLSALRYLDLWTIKPIHVPTTPFTIPDPSNSIRSLTIGSFVDTEVLVELIDACQGLESFLLQHQDEPWGYTWTVEERNPHVEINYDKLTLALSKHWRTLEVIQIEEDMGLRRRSSAPNVIRSLTHLPGLHCLHIPGEALLDPEAPAADAVAKLPPSLITLELTGISPKVSSPSFLRHLALRQQESSGLEKVTIKFKEYSRSFLLLTRQITKGLGNVGIKLVVLYARVEGWPFKLWREIFIDDEDDGNE